MNLIRRIFKVRNDNESTIIDKSVLEEEPLNESHDEDIFIDMNRTEAQNLIHLIDKENLLTTTKDIKNTKEIADGILENKFFLMNSLEIIDFSKGIDWNYQHPTSANTYRLYIQCLNVLSHLVDAYQLTGDQKYLIKAKEILWDWRNNILHDNTDNKYKWVDHSVANRVLNIIYFYTVGHNVITIEEEIIVPILIKHGEFLNNDKHYRPNNHGIMVDRSLIYLSNFLKNYKESDNWFQKAKLRVTNAAYRDFSSKGVHLENSPSYHTMTRRMFNDLERYLQSIDLTLGKEVRQKIFMSNDYIRYIMKPNKELPIIGDTQVSRVRWLEKSYESFQDVTAGITILQNKAKDTHISTWIAFICGYGSSTHKHRDDLSISLFHNDEDIFIDSGRYNYDGKDKIRKYLLSPQAHSTLTIKNEDYKIEEPYKYRNTIKTTDFSDNPIYSYVKGINNAYEGCELTRSILYIKPDILVIKDRGVANENKEFEQIFNLNDTFEIRNDQTNIVIIQSDKNKVGIKQILKTTNKPNIVYSDENAPRAIISKEFGKYVPTKQLVYNAKGKEVEFITVIKLNYQEDQDINIDYNSINSLLNISYNSISLSLVI